MALAATDVNSGGFARDADGRILVNLEGATTVVSGTATLANVASSATNVTLLAANTARLGATITNDSTQVLYVKFGATASATSYTVQIAAGGYYEVPQPVFTGKLDGLWASANGNARVTETSA